MLWIVSPVLTFFLSFHAATNTDPGRRSKLGRQHVHLETALVGGVSINGTTLSSFPQNWIYPAKLKYFSIELGVTSFIDIIFTLMILLTLNDPYCQCGNNQTKHLFFNCPFVNHYRDSLFHLDFGQLPSFQTKIPAKSLTLMTSCRPFRMEMAISNGGSDHCWYKCPNFTLKF